MRTVRLDLFGHGYSARPAEVHDYALFTRQVCDLLEHLGLEGQMQLFGHSMGSAVAARLMLAAPSRFGSLVMGVGDLIATPAHMEILVDSLPRAEFHVIEDAAHALILTHPQQVASHVIPSLTCPKRRVDDFPAPQSAPVVPLQ